MLPSTPATCRRRAERRRQLVQFDQSAEYQRRLRLARRRGRHVSLLQRGVDTTLRRRGTV
jgi:hypothetical protein